MSSRAPILRDLLVLSFALGGAVQAGAQLATKSPFMSANSPGAAAPTAGAPLEYRGMMQTSEGLKVRIVDPSRRGGGVWLLANERDPAFDFVVKQIDMDHDTVTIDYQGRPLTLAQHVAKVVSAGAAQMPPPGMLTPSNMPAAITQSVVVNPTPADEQRRLEAVASEVARRRQLREQASQQATPTAPLTLPQVQQQLQQPAQNGGQPNNTNNAQSRGGNNQRPRGSQP